jgi:hypothetical protein
VVCVQHCLRTHAHNNQLFCMNEECFLSCCLCNLSFIISLLPFGLIYYLFRGMRSNALAIESLSDIYFHAFFSITNTSIKWKHTRAFNLTGVLIIQLEGKYMFCIRSEIIRKRFLQRQFWHLVEIHRLYIQSTRSLSG